MPGILVKPSPRILLDMVSYSSAGRLPADERAASLANAYSTHETSTTYRATSIPNPSAVHIATLLHDEVLNTSLYDRNGIGGGPQNTSCRSSALCAYVQSPPFEHLPCKKEFECLPAEQPLPGNDICRQPQRPGSSRSRSRGRGLSRGHGSG